MPYSTTYTAQSSNELNKGQYMGIQGMTFSIALIITPILSTMIISKYGFSKLWIFNIVITILASILLLILSKLHKKSF